MLFVSTPTKPMCTSHRPRSRATIFPEFLQASEHEDDPYWKQVLVNASQGEFSSKLTMYIDGRLTRKDLTTPGVRIPKSDPASIARIFIRFHKKHERTLSDQELVKQVSRTYEVCSRHVTLSWSTASVHMKRAALNYYATRTCETMSFLSQADRGRCMRDLSATLLTAFSLKLLDESTVHMLDNIIVDVSCIRYNKKENFWVIAQKRKTR